jgi:hypothetical protein
MATIVGWQDLRRLIHTFSDKVKWLLGVENRWQNTDQTYLSISSYGLMRAQLLKLQLPIPVCLVATLL